MYRQPLLLPSLIRSSYCYPEGDTERLDMDVKDGPSPRNPRQQKHDQWLMH